MKIDEIARIIITDENKRNKLIENYSNGIKKTYNIRTDYILDSLNRKLNCREIDKDVLLEGYLIFLIKISFPFLEDEKKLIIEYSNILLKKDLKKLNSNQILIIIAGKILEESKKEQSDIIFKIDNKNKDVLKMNPSIQNGKLTGIITLSENILNMDLESDKRLVVLLFAFYHEYEHFRRLKRINNTRIDSREKLNQLKEFIVVFIKGYSKFYSYYHDSFEIEKRADKYAYIKTISVIENLNLDNLTFLMKLVRETYNNNRAYDDISIKEYEELLNENFKHILKTNKKELEELSLYIPVIKKMINIKKNKQKRL